MDRSNDYNFIQRNRDEIIRLNFKPRTLYFDKIIAAPSYGVFSIKFIRLIDIPHRKLFSLFRR